MAFLNHELIDPGVSLVVLVLLDVGDHLIEPLRFEVVLCLSHIEVLSESLKLLQIVAQLGGVNTGLSPEVVALLSDQVCDFNDFGGLVQFDVLAVGFLLIIVLEPVDLLDLVVVTLIRFVFFDVGFLLHTSQEVEHGTVLLHKAVGKQLELVFRHVLELVPPIHFVGTDFLLHFEHHKAFLPQKHFLLGSHILFEGFLL